jgi:hypothetical protein
MYALLIREIFLKLIALFNTFLLIPLRQKLQFRQRLKRTSILYPIYSWIILLDYHDIILIIVIYQSTIIMK